MFQKILSKKKHIAIVAVVVIIAAVFFVWQKNSFSKDPSLKEAAKMGEIATHKLMIQIEAPKGREEDMSGRYERGDIVLIFPADHQFSLAEKEGFLIVQMDLTPTQAEILTRAKAESLGGEASKLEAPKTLKRRKFTVDLSKLGIAPEDRTGREIGDKIFSWDVVTEKS